MLLIEIFSLLGSHCPEGSPQYDGKTHARRRTVIVSSRNGHALYMPAS
jgi:hypothetical protein